MIQAGITGNPDPPAVISQFLCPSILGTNKITKDPIISAAITYEIDATLSITR